MSRYEKQIDSKKRRARQVLVIMLLLLPVVILISLQLGYSDMHLSDLIRIFSGQGSQKERLILFDFRLPRIVMALLIGAGFSVSGCILQGLTKNPLADPGIIGINAGGGLVVVIFLVFVGTLNFHSIFVMPFFSLMGAALSGALIYQLSSHRFKGLQSTSLILNGIAIQAGLNAIMMLVILKMDKGQYDFLARWQAGSIWNSNWQLVIALLPWITIGLAAALFMAKSLDLLYLGEEPSRALGLKTKQAKRQLLLVAIAMSAASVSMSGSIGFLGLMAPHISRKLVGIKHKLLIPASAMVGGIMMLAADVVARKIASPAELPTGIVVAAIGAPYFLFLLMTSGNKNKY